ncbi:hypothetical protein BC833DRAFT_570303 [Globomyces pollinis-pini]|nr:hypothetical protein BC833DRAFT_570303 [Globomyces pollinis-pini]
MPKKIPVFRFHGYHKRLIFSILSFPRFTRLDRKTLPNKQKPIKHTNHIPDITGLQSQKLSLIGQLICFFLQPYHDDTSEMESDDEILTVSATMFSKTLSTLSIKDENEIVIDVLIEFQNYEELIIRTILIGLIVFKTSIQSVHLNLRGAYVLQWSFLCLSRNLWITNQVYELVFIMF